MNESFEQTYGLSFEESLLLNNSNLEKKHSCEDRRQIKKQHFREAVEKIESDYEYTLVDRVYGGRNSLRKHDNGRMKQFFETVPAATKRTFEEKDKIEKGLKKPKNHVGNFSSYQIETTSASKTKMVAPLQNVAKLRKVSQSQEEFVDKKNVCVLVLAFQ